MNPTNDKALLALIADARPEQQRAIRSRKPLVVVSAGAGTGKTHTLARRFAWLLASDPTCRVDQILTLTFTQLAAVEMRERIKATLVQWYRELGESLPHLRDAIERIEEAYISTIHSFALRAIRESGLSLDVDPGASMVGEPEEREFWADFAWNLETLNVDRLCLGLDEAWQLRARAMMSTASFVDFSNYFGATALAKLAKDAGELHGSMNLRPEELWDFDPARERRVKEGIAALLAPTWRETWELWHGIVFSSASEALYEGKENKFSVTIRALYEKWRGRERSEAAERDFYIDLVGDALKALPGQSRLKNVIEGALGAKLTDWRSDERRAYAEISSTLQVEPGYGEEEAAARRLLMRTAALGWASWEQARGRAGTLSFADLIRLAGDAVEIDPAYAKKFRHIMIDEFQDTDGLQENLAASLKEAWGDDGEGRSLFVVGDIKQSIYRFRHANPKLFADYIRRAENAGEVGEHISLSCSYRMSAGMMGDVNAAFGFIWEKGVIGGSDAPAVRYDPLEAPEDALWWKARNRYAEEAPALEILLAVERGESDGEGERDEKRARILKGEKRRVLATALAKKLRGMIAAETPVWDKNLPAGPDGGKFRPLRWSDVAVLVPTRTQYPALEEVFEEAGIPAAFGGGREYFNRGEVRDLVNLLRLLDRRDEDYALLGWMESPFSGMPPEVGLGLLSLARSRGCGLEGLFAENHPDRFAELENLRRHARVLGPSASLLLLLQDQRWLAAYRNEARGRVLANVRRCVDIVREYEVAFGRGLSACADYLGRAMRESAPIEEANAAVGGGGVLQVMTVHASKGLEFPVVVVMGMEDSAKKEGRASKASVSTTLGAIAKKLPRLVGEDPSDEEEVLSTTARWHSFVESREQIAEKERLLYVAMTRAQERLICCGIGVRTTGADGEEILASKADETGESWIDWLLRANRAAKNAFPMTVVEVGADDPKGEESSLSVARNFTIDAESAPLVLSPAKGPDLRLERLSASAYSLLAWCPFAYRMRYRQGRELTWEMPDGDGYGGADMGTLAHWVLSRWDLEPGTLAQHLRPELEKRELEEHIRALPAFLRPVYSSGGVRKVLFEWLSTFAGGSDCAELRRAEERGLLKKELSFRVPFAGARLVGSIDVFWEDEAGCHVRDWKITPERSAPEEMYLNQIRFYALACRCAKPEATVDVGLLYLRPAVAGVPKRCAGAVRIDDWDALRESVESTLRVAAAGPFSLTRAKCRICPFSKLCADTDRS